MLALRLTAFDHLVDIGRDRGAARHRAPTTASLWVGAGTTEAAVERDDEVAAAVPLLARATPFIGHFQIRNRGTVGGSIAHADPAAEYPAVALALDAELDVLSARGARTIAAADFFDGLWTTDDGARRAAGRRSGSRCGRGGAGSRSRRSRAATVTSPSPAPRSRSRSTTTIGWPRCAIGLFGMGSTAGAGHGAPRPLRSARRRRARRRRSSAARRSTSSTDVPADLHGSAAYRTHGRRGDGRPGAAPRRSRRPAVA